MGCMIPREQTTKAVTLLDLHRGPRILVLPNAWDVASARIFEEAGFPAVATTSAGVANSLGYADGQQISRDEMLEVVARIARAVRVPVTADMESAYSATPEGVAETARAVISAGAVGMNFEDSTGDPSMPLFDLAAQAEKIRAIREAAASAGIRLALNARTDVYLARVGEQAGRFDHAVRRANAYREAGADCLFVPGVYDRETIVRLTKAIHGPVNILAGPETPPAAELERFGVARLSVGSGVMRASMALTRRIAIELRDAGTYGFTVNSIPFAEANALFKRT